MCANPQGGGDHSYDCHHDADNALGKYNLGSVLRDVMVEGSDYSEDEPGNAGGSTPRMNTPNMLQETGPEDTHPQGRPLRNSIRSRGLTITDAICRTF